MFNLKDVPEIEVLSEVETTDILERNTNYVPEEEPDIEVDAETKARPLEEEAVEAEVGTVEDIIIDEEFKNLISRLSDWEYEQLKASIRTEGCRDPLVLWGKILVDGHHRYEICIEHDVEFNTTQIELENRREAKFWIYRNQAAKRNWNMYQRAASALKLKPEIKEEAKAKQLAGLKQYQNTVCQNSDKRDEPIDTKKELAKFANVSHDTMGRVMYLDEHALPEEKEKLRKGDASINEIYRKAKKRERQTERETPLLPEGEYNVIYADPPWRYRNSGVLAAAEKKYPTMALEDICALEIPSAENAVLFLWVTSSFARDAFTVIDAWSFQYKSQIVWVKRKLKAPGVGFYVRGRHELLYICTKGSFVPDQKGKEPIASVIEADLQEHSRKPDVVYDIIERMYPDGKYLELFARNKRAGWTSWGNEI